MRVVNEGRVDYKYKVSPQSPYITITVVSNTVSTTIIRKGLAVKILVHKEYASFYDSLYYKIRIKNISGHGLDNVTLMNFVADGTKFIYHSIKINNQWKRCVEPSSGVFIGRVEPGEIVLINYQAVIEVNTLGQIVSNCTVYYDYIFNIEKPPIPIPIYSNIVVTVLKDNIFKQILVDNTIELPRVLKKKDIKRIDTNIKIQKTKFMRSLIYEDACILLCYGIIEYRIYFMYQNRVCALKQLEGFHSALLVPIGIIYFKHLKVKTMNISTRCSLIEDSELLLITSLLLKI